MSGNVRHDTTCHHAAMPVLSSCTCCGFEQPTIAPEPWACPHCAALVQPPPTSYGAVLRFGTPDTPMEDVLWATGPQGPFCGEAGRQNGLRVVDKVCSEKLLAELYTFVSAAPDKRVTRQSDRPVYEPRFASKDIEGQVLESWYQTDAWIEAASDPTNSFWSLEGERVSLSTRQRVEDFSCLVALEKAVRDAFAEIGERQLFNVQLVQQKRQHRPYHADGPSNGGDIIIGLTISQSRMLGFKVTTARDGSYVRNTDAEERKRGSKRAATQDGRRRSNRLKTVNKH